MNSSQNLYNTPMEVGIRLLTILVVSDNPLDSDSLRYIDHLSLHTSDIGKGPSLHASVPNRGIQVFAKKELVDKAIKFLLSKQLIKLKFTKVGFKYSTTEISSIFINYFTSEYLSQYRDKVKLVLLDFGSFSPEELTVFINKLAISQEKGIISE